MTSSHPHDADSPAALYRARLQACRVEAVARRKQHILLGYLRLALAALGIALVWLTLVQHRLHWEWLAVPWLGFACTAHVHAKVLAAGARSQRAAEWYEHGLARIDDRWAGLRARAARSDLSASLYAADLDIFGNGSLFELLCTARTTIGEDTLAGWLLQPATAEVIRTRQIAVADLRDRTGLREDIASIPGQDVINLDREPLVRWAELTESALPSALHWIVPLLAMFTVAAALRWALAGSPLLLLLALLVNVTIHYGTQRRLGLTFKEAQQAAARLGPIAELYATLERERFDSPALQALQRNLQGGPRPASVLIRRLAMLSGAIEKRGALRMLDVPFLFSLHLALLLQRWRETCGQHTANWLEALGDFEALLSLATYHFEHPGDPFPEIEDAGALFAAEELGHPLLKDATCVRNSVALDNRTRVLIVSGSNMSGKSTLLRSVGVAAVLAMAGAPVRARRLRITPMRIGASIQINDSLQSGRSRFFAEILRLRAITQQAREDPPLLFLLDELLAGTNSSDRLAGATGLVNELLTLETIGLLSTHDLALTTVAGEHADLIRNAHFADRMDAEELAFDYTLRDGAVTRTNGLALMRLIGLRV